MKVGINAGFGDQIAHEFSYLQGIGFDFVRQDILPTFNDDDLRSRVAEFVNAPVSPLFLLAGGTMKWPDGRGRVEPHEIAALASRLVGIAADVGLADYMIEVGNEPDLAHADYAQRPQDFAEAVRQTREAARTGGFPGTVVSGGVSNLNGRGLDYLAKAVQSGLIPGDITIGFHRYPDGDGPRNPHEGFKSREAEWQRLTSLSGQRPVACTEFGHHTGDRKLGLFKRGCITDVLVAAHIVFDLEFFNAKGCTMAALYQLNDGPNQAPIDLFGIRRFNGDDKPCVAALRDWIGANV